MATGELFPAILDLLEDTFQLTGWTIAHAAAGQQKECYVARTTQRAAFLKLDGNTPVDVLRRLGELDVAPHVIRAGEIAGRPYVLQDYVSGAHPGWRWFADHLPLLARVARRYQSDRHLQQLLAAAVPPTYHEHLSAELAVFAPQLSAVLADSSHTLTVSSTVRRVFAALKS